MFGGSFGIFDEGKVGGAPAGLVAGFFGDDGGFKGVLLGVKVGANDARGRDADLEESVNEVGGAAAFFAVAEDVA